MDSLTYTLKLPLAQRLLRYITLMLGIVFCSGALVTTSHAQLDESPGSLNEQAIALMNQAKWEEALVPLDRCIELYGARAEILFGPKFGGVYYRKGVCELKLKRWEAAAQSFKTCREKYPNGKADEGNPANPFENLSLLRWGEAMQGAENYEEAINLFKKFLDVRDKDRDKFQPGPFFINLAICNLKLGKLDEGIKHYETALKNRKAYNTPDTGIVAAFQALGEAAIEKGDDEVLIKFLNNYRADIVIEPYQMFEYSPLFLSLAAQSFQAEMLKSTFALYQLVPSTQVMLEDVESYLARMGDRPGIKDGKTIYRRDALEKSRAAIQKSLRSGDPNEVVQLSATAYIHENMGNITGAYTAYEQLETLYKKSKKRETNLYQLVRTASLLGEVPNLEKYGTLFLNTYPESDYAVSVRQMLLSSLFYAGKYDVCIENATKMLPLLDEGTDMHDMCLHVLGGSYYYTNKNQEAAPLLEKHVTDYPKSAYRMASVYFNASNFVRLREFEKAGKLLDEFLKEFPNADNPYLPFALFDRAQCHYELNQFEPAMEKLNRLVNEFPQSQVTGMAYNLKGNIAQAQEKPEEAEQSYVKALEIGESRYEDYVAGEALNHLISLLGPKPPKGEPDRYADTLKYADKFWAKYSEESPYKADVSVNQIPAFQSVGRGKEALDKLKEVILELANTPEGYGLDVAINAFTDLYLENNSVEKLKALYYDFQGIPRDNKAAHALLRIELIRVFEQLIKDAGDDEQAKIKGQAAVNVTFKDLKDDFDLADLSPYILVRVGDFIRESTSSPKQSVPYYAAAIERKDPMYTHPAILGRAGVLATGADADKKKAIADFESILKDEDAKKGDRDRALHGIIKAQVELGEYKTAIENAAKYAKAPDKGGYGFTKFKREVAILLATAYDKLNDVNNAIAAYITVSGSYPGAIGTSAPATKRAMELMWQRNQTPENTVSDRQGAYNFGREYVDMTRRAALGDGKTPSKASAEEVKMWRAVESLVEEYVADPKVKSKEELSEK